MSSTASSPVSEQLYKAAQNVIPGGVNSPVRAFKGVGGTPRFFTSGDGAWITDVDGNHYIDYIGAWGPLILGHRYPAIIDALREQLDNGVAFGAPTEQETLIAEKICQLVPSIDSIRLVNSGTEATMSAIRLARGFTGRDKVLKFEGCYHGHVDSLLVKAGSGALTLGSPDSAGIPAGTAEQTFVLPYNDADAVAALFEQNGHEIACIIIEPVAGNMNMIPPVPGYLEALRDITNAHGSLLIFDEVMTGFRVALGGAQGHFGVTPDLTTLGKIIGGGLPVGAFGGRRDIMDQLSPNGPVYQAGTLSGNPLAVVAGLTMLNTISEPGFHDSLNEKTSHLLQGLQERADAAGIPFRTHQLGAMFGCFFTDADKLENLDDVVQCDLERFKRYYHLMLDQGIYLAPSAYEAGFMSAAHREEEILLTLQASENAFSKL